jgi:hypothetical protein
MESFQVRSGLHQSKPSSQKESHHALRKLADRIPSFYNKALSLFLPAGDSPRAIEGNVFRFCACQESFSGGKPLTRRRKQNL